MTAGISLVKSGGRYSICSHEDGDKVISTTASIIAQPAKGKLYVTRGNPCMNWAKCYTVD